MEVFSSDFSLIKCFFKIFFSCHYEIISFKKYHYVPVLNKLVAMTTKNRQQTITRNILDLMFNAASISYRIILKKKKCITSFKIIEFIYKTIN